MNDKNVNIAMRTAFVSRFIVLREARRSRAHRKIEDMAWEEDTSAEELRDRFLAAFVDNGDKLEPVERDISRAMEHASKSIKHFIDPYLSRAGHTFREALEDYKKSNVLLFGEDVEEEVGDVRPKEGGWRL